MQNIQCKVCDVGSLHRESIPLMSRPVRLIGMILLVPSFLGMLAGAFVLLAALWSGVSAAAQPKDAKEEMSSWSEERVVERYLELKGLAPGEIDRLLKTRDVEQALGGRAPTTKDYAASAALGWLQTPERDALEWFKGKPTSRPKKSGSGFLGGAFTGLSIVVGALVSGLLGFLLTTKRRALVCDNCTALAPAA